MYEVLELCHNSPLVFSIRREDGEGGIRILHRNLLLPFKTRILDEELTPQSTPQEELVDSTQAGTLEDPIQEDQEDSSEDEQDPDSVSRNGVSTRPWTRSQGPPPVLVGTQSLSKLNSFPAARAEGNSKVQGVCW